MPANATEAPGGIVVSDVSLAIAGIRILDSISFTVKPDETVGLIGANGSGKSSVLNVISGYYRPTRGRVFLGGTEITSMKPDRIASSGVGRSFQSINRMEELTVWECIALGLEPAWPSRRLAGLLGLSSSRASEAKAREDAIEFATSFGIGEYAKARLRDCPYGVRKVADLLRSIVSQPRVLLLDEPTSGVAASDRKSIAELIRNWRKKYSCSIVIVDHDVSFVSELTSSLVALSAGKIIASGDRDAVLGNPAVLATFVGEAAK